MVGRQPSHAAQFRDYLGELVIMSFAIATTAAAAAVSLQLVGDVRFSFVVISGCPPSVFFPRDGDIKTIWSQSTTNTTESHSTKHPFRRAHKWLSVWRIPTWSIPFRIGSIRLRWGGAPYQYQRYDDVPLFILFFRSSKRPPVRPQERSTRQFIIIGRVSAPGNSKSMSICLLWRSSSQNGDV